MSDHNLTIGSAYFADHKNMHVLVTIKGQPCQRIVRTVLTRIISIVHVKSSVPKQRQT